MLLTIRQAREQLATQGVQVSQWTIWHWIKNLKKLKAIKVGSRWYVDSAELERLVKSGTR